MAANARIGLGRGRIGEGEEGKNLPQEGNCHPDNRNNEPTQDYSRFIKKSNTNCEKNKTEAAKGRQVKFGGQKIPTLSITQKAGKWEHRNPVPAPFQENDKDSEKYSKDAIFYFFLKTKPRTLRRVQKRLILRGWKGQSPLLCNGHDQL